MGNYLASECYWKYLESSGVTLDSNSSSRVTAILEVTSWEEPTSATELNNVAVIALIEAEQSQDSSIRELYLNLALEALNKGVELQSHLLCAAHLTLVLALTGEMEQAMQTAFSNFINTLPLAYINEQPIVPGIVYLPLPKRLTESRHEKITQILQSNDGYHQSILLLSEVLCRSQLIFYNLTSLRFLHLAAQLSHNSSTINLKLGLSSLLNSQWEGLLYLYRARQLSPNHAPIIQALYLAYRDLGEIERAKYWLSIGSNFIHQNPSSIDWQWTELEVDSLFTYVPFESELLLAVEPSFRSIVTSVLIAEGDWFEKEMEFWRNQIKPGMTVIDVGANVGVYTFSAALQVGVEGHVFAVEPFSGCVRCLQETCRINQLSWVKVCAGAASNYNGTAQLAIHSANEFNEIVTHDIEGEIPLGNFEEVNCFSLDSLVNRQNVKQVDFLKIDAEGHEIQVLEGSKHILSEHFPCIIYENIAGSKGSNLEVSNFLRAKGYQLYRYQPYLKELILVDADKDFQGLLNVIAIHCDKSSHFKVS